MKIIRKINDSSGFTLIEVLVAMFIVAIGLLGLAGLQVTALQNNHSAYLRSQATILASSIIDRVRANPVGVSAGAYNEGTASQTTGCSSAATGCTAVEMAGNDLYVWESMVASQLPAGVGVVCIDDTPDDGTDETDTNNSCSNSGDMYVVKIWWRDDRSGNLQRFVTTFKP